jgi:hypothetical protein
MTQAAHLCPALDGSSLAAADGADASVNVRRESQIVVNAIHFDLVILCLPAKHLMFTFQPWRLSITAPPADAC